MAMAMTSEQASALADGAIARAGSLGIAISVAVLDATGHLKLLTRMDGAGWFTPDIAFGKAFAAAALGKDTEEMVERLRGGKEIFAGALAPLSGGKLVLGQGGCLVRVADEVIGAVGCSGGSSEQDAECAREGIGRL